MASRFGSKESKRPTPLTMLQQNKKPAAEIIRRKHHPPPQQDLTDFMNDMFFGTVKVETKSYNLTGDLDDYLEGSPNSSTPTTPTSSTTTPTSANARISNSRSTQEWLEEAKRIVASSPSRSSSPARLPSGSPRFAAPQGQAARLSLSSSLERRDPLSRSARRYRAAESLSGEIISKTTAKHSRNRSEAGLDTPSSPASNSEAPSPATSVHKWFSNILKPSNQEQESIQQPLRNPDPTPVLIPPRQLGPRRSRFQNDPSSPRPQGIPTPSRRTFQSPTTTHDNKLLLSPPKDLVPSAQRRSISSSTCSVEKALIRVSAVDEAQAQDQGGGRGIDDLNEFLKEQKRKVLEVLDGQVNSKARIVLSDPSNSTSSMVATICYAWLLENRVRKENKKSKKARHNARDDDYVVVPVMNVKRGRMWKQREAAWLFYHVDLDVTSLLFADEVDLESLMMAGKLNILVTGQDVLRNNGEVGSQCTILTDNYCEDAYHLLDNPLLKKLLLAGILLDTQNMKASGNLSMTRDAEAVQLLLVGLPSNYRNALFDQLTQHQGDSSFLEALRQNYGKSPKESNGDGSERVNQKVPERTSASSSRRETNLVQNSNKNAHDNVKSAKKGSPKPALATKSPVPAVVAPPTKGAPSPNRGKNQFFLAKWFGFGNK